MNTKEYPEYLNPFKDNVKGKHKTSLGLRESFRRFTKPLRSLRRKSKDDSAIVATRLKTDSFVARPVTITTSYSQPESFSGTLFPRSRFQERLPKRQQDYPSAGLNPFEDADSDEDARSVTLRRKHKKRAPLPPKSLSNQDINNAIENAPHSSNWSLTSVETDYTDNISGSECNDAQGRLSFTEKIADFTKNMEMLNDDSNNNVITSKSEEQNYPDVVISCPSDTDSAKVKQKEEDTYSKSSSDDSVDMIIKDITANLVIPEEYPEPEEHSEPAWTPKDDEYYGTKSLKKEGSHDKLNDFGNYIQTVSLNIIGSQDSLDECNNKHFDKKTCEEYVDSAPVPKQRKQKLNKTLLLGV